MILNSFYNVETCFIAVIFASLFISEEILIKGICLTKELNEKSGGRTQGGNKKNTARRSAKDEEERKMEVNYNFTTWQLDMQLLSVSVAVWMTVSLRLWFVILLSKHRVHALSNMHSVTPGIGFRENITCLHSAIHRFLFWMQLLIFAVMFINGC